MLDTAGRTMIRASLLPSYADCARRAALTVTFAGTVNSVTSSLIFASNALTQAAGYFTGGEVRWLTGANAGLKREVKEFANKQIILALPMPYAIANGDTFNVLAGCDKLFATCKAKFNNVANFRGEPHIPGTDAILKTAGTFQ